MERCLTHRKYCLLLCSMLAGFAFGQAPPVPVARGWTAGPFNTADFALGPANTTFVVSTERQQNSSSSFNGIAQITKFSAAGSVLWTRQVMPVGSNHSEGQTAATDSTGNAYMTVIGVNDSDPSKPAIYTGFLYKIDPAGRIAWTIPLPGPGGRAKVDPLGNIYVADYPVDHPGPYISKYSSAGKQLWMKTPTQGLQICNQLVLNQNGGAFVLSSYGQGYLHQAILESWGPDGKLVFSNSVMLNGMPTFATLVASAKAEYVLYGDASSAPQLKPMIVKFDEAGNTLWTKPYANTAGYATGFAAAMTDRAGNIVTTLEINSSNSLVKIDPNGSVLWHIQDLTGETLATDAYSNIYVVGLSGAVDFQKPIFEKLTPGGRPLWSITDVNTLADVGYDLPPIVDTPTGAIFVTGNSHLTTFQQAPVTRTATYKVSGPSLTAPAPGVLGPDWYVRGATIVLKTAPSHGTLTLNHDGSFTYTPESGYVGTDSFVYYLKRGTLLSARAIVKLTVGQPR